MYKRQEIVLEDLDQAMFIKRFISKSVNQVLKQYQNNNDLMVNDFCDDDKIFIELEESNQLDIKGNFY